MYKSIMDRLREGPSVQRIKAAAESVANAAKIVLAALLVAAAAPMLHAASPAMNDTASPAAVITGAAYVYAEPVVIKDSEKGIEPERTGAGTGDAGAKKRDRSLQDGTLIYSMSPVYPEDIREGVYDVEALSDSRFFKITAAELDNEGGSMKAVISLSSTSYAYVYPGTADQAAAADSSEWIPADESEGYGRFTLAVEALNKEMPCAAYSKSRDKWYDRNIVFLASSLPDDALLIELSDEGATIADTQQQAVQVIYIALGIIIAGGILNHFVKKRYYE